MDCKEQNQQTPRQTHAWSEFRAWVKDRFSLEDDKAAQSEITANISKGTEFRGVNLWVLICAALVASLGLNVNSTAVIIGAMCISPIMGPIMGIGFSVGINDFDLLKKSARNFVLMFVVAIITATVYFFISPLGNASSELLARTVPTTYDVLIALFGGMAGAVAQSRQDRTSTVIPGVAIATALMPPLCTAGYGLATGQMKFFLGAFYLFFINTVFIALATYIFTRFMKYEKKTFLDRKRERFVKRVMFFITVATFVPSVIIGFRMVRVSIFEAQADKYISQVFNFPHTRVVEATRTYHGGRDVPRIELLLMGEPLDESVVENARGQLFNYGLRRAELVVRQASGSDKVDLQSLQSGYAELLDEKNAQLAEMRSRLARYQVTNVDIGDISKEVGTLIDNVESMSLTKGMIWDVSGKALDTVLICVVTPKDHMRPIEENTLRRWLSVRTKVKNVKLFVDPKANE